MNTQIPNARTPVALASAALAALVLGGCASSSEDVNTLPAGLSGAIAEKAYDGTTDDLLTAGLG
jgi:hydroxybutyrate-dimer hydrolase